VKKRLVPSPSATITLTPTPLYTPPPSPTGTLPSPTSSPTVTITFTPFISPTMIPIPTPDGGSDTGAVASWWLTDVLYRVFVPTSQSYDQFATFRASLLGKFPFSTFNNIYKVFLNGIYGTNEFRDSADVPDTSLPFPPRSGCFSFSLPFPSFETGSFSLEWYASDCLSLVTDDGTDYLLYFRTFLTIMFYLIFFWQIIHMIVSVAGGN